MYQKPYKIFMSFDLVMAVTAMHPKWQLDLCTKINEQEGYLLQHYLQQ